MTLSIDDRLRALGVRLVMERGYSLEHADALIEVIRDDNRSTRSLEIWERSFTKGNDEDVNAI